jgi:predicted dehydrogenase
MDIVRIGVIGLGMISEQVHLPGISRSTNAKIFAICDKNIARLNSIGDRYQIPADKRFTEYEEFLKVPEIDAVDIVTPNFAHHDPMIMACENKKHVCIEKPLAMNYEQAREMQSAAKKAGITGMICFSYRFYGAIRFAKWMIDEGYVGDIANVYIQFLKGSASDEGRSLEWRFRKELAGSGVLSDLGAHMIDLTRFLAGDMTSLCSQKMITVSERKTLDSEKVEQVTTDDSCNTIAALKSGGIANIALSRCAIGNVNSVKVAVYGKKGMVRFDSDRLDEIEVCYGKPDLMTNTVHAIKIPDSFRADQMDSFARRVKGEADPYFPTLEDGVECQRLIDAMIYSSDNGKWVNV